MVSESLNDVRDGRGSVAAIVCTYRRSEMLKQCIEGILAQTQSVAEIVVVDNGGDRDTTELLSEGLPRVTHLRMPENLGPAGGFARGMRHAYEQGHEHLWLFNDDAVPRPEALGLCFEARRLFHGTPGIAAHGAMPTKSLDYDYVEYFNFNGALVERSVVSAVGYPREDFFMCYEEDDYCLRIRKAGIPIVNIPGNYVTHVFAGTIDGATPPWRGYYQTRNELASAIEEGSFISIAKWITRTAKFSVATLFAGDDKAMRLRLRLLGTWHALRGILGRTIEPTETGGS
jgi:GT2 family glycosyltransferase